MITAVLALAAATPWLYVNTTRNDTVIYVRADDVANGHPSSRDARMWVRQDYRRDRTIPLTEAKVLYAVDCVARTTVQLSITFYDLKGAPGTATGNPWDAKPIVPDSIMDDATRMLCGDK